MARGGVRAHLTPPPPRPAVARSRCACLPRLGGRPTSRTSVAATRPVESQSVAMPQPTRPATVVATTSVTPAATARRGRSTQALEEAFGGEQDHENEDRAEDDLAPLAEPRVREPLLQRIDDDGADDGAEPVPPASEHAHHDHEQRHGEVEDALRGQVPDLERRHCARQRTEDAGDRDREHLVAEGRHAELLGDVLLVANREQPPAEPRVLDQEGGDRPQGRRPRARGGR